MPACFIKEKNIVNEVEKMDYFYCYSPKLRRFIHEHGIRWVDKGINKNSGYMRWVFEQTDELSDLLSRYKEEN